MTATAMPPGLTAEAAGPRRFRPDIQGLRAVAVGLVVAYHAGVPFITGGYIGVDVFFVISGFLMTSRLSRMLTEGGRIRFGEFYSSRIRRILPVAFVVLAVTLVAAIVVSPPLRFLQIAQDAIATALYVPNILFAVQGTTYLGSHDASPYQHYWSLGVEEQFYLVWPLLLAGIWLLVRRSVPRLAAVIAGIVVVSLVACVVLTAISQPWAFFSLWTRAWELGAGGIVALLGRRLTLPSGPVAAVIGWLGLAAVLVAALRFNDATSFPGRAAIIPVVGTAVVIWAGSRVSRGDPTLLLGTRPFRFIGDISYSLYLWHWPLLIIPTIALGGPPSLPWRLLLAVVAIGLAVVSYRFIELPFRESARIKGWRVRRTVAFALVTAVALAGISWGSGQIFGLRTLDLGPAVATGTPTRPPVFAKNVPRNLTPALPNALADVPEIFTSGCMHGDPTALPPCIYGDTSGTTVWAMFGDSHMASWFPATNKYALAHHIKLVVFGKTSCAVADIVPFVNGAPFQECLDWRKLIIKKIDRLKPSVIVMGDSSRTAMMDTDGKTVLDSTSGSSVALFNAGLTRTFAKLPAASRLIFVADNPSFTSDPVVCLSAHPRDAAACWEPRSAVLDSAWDDALGKTMAAAGGYMIDLNDYLCTATTCGAIEGNTMMYSDTAHLSNSGGLFLAPVFDRQLEAALGK